MQALSQLRLSLNSTRRERNPNRGCTCSVPQRSRRGRSPSRAGAEIPPDQPLSPFAFFVLSSASHSHARSHAPPPLSAGGGGPSSLPTWRNRMPSELRWSIPGRATSGEHPLARSLARRAPLSDSASLLHHKITQWNARHVLALATSPHLLIFIPYGLLLSPQVCLRV